MIFTGSRAAVGAALPLRLGGNRPVQQVPRNKFFSHAVSTNNVNSRQAYQQELMTYTDARRDELRQRRSDERRGLQCDPNPLPPRPILVKPPQRFPSTSDRVRIHLLREIERRESRGYTIERKIQAVVYLHGLHAQFNKQVSDLLALLLDDPNDDFAARLEGLLASLRGVEPALKCVDSWAKDSHWDWAQYILLHTRLYDQVQRCDSPGAELQPLITGLERYSFMVGLQLNGTLRNDRDHLEFDFSLDDSQPFEELSGGFGTAMQDAPDNDSSNSATTQPAAEQTSLKTLPQINSPMQPVQPPNSAASCLLDQLPPSLYISMSSLSLTSTSSTNASVPPPLPIPTSYVSNLVQTNYVPSSVQPLVFTSLEDFVSALTLDEYLGMCDVEVHNIKQRLSSIPQRIQAHEINEISAGVSSLLANMSMTWFDSSEFAKTAKPWCEKVFNLRAHLRQPGWEWCTIQEVIRNLIVDLDVVHDIVAPPTSASNTSFPTSCDVIEPSGTDNTATAPSDTTGAPTEAATTPTAADTHAYTEADISAATMEDIMAGTGAFDPASIQTLPHALAIFSSTPFSSAVDTSIAEVKYLIANKMSTAMPATTFLRRACTYLTENKVVKWKIVQDDAEVVNFRVRMADVNFRVLATCTDDTLNAEAVALGKDITKLEQWFDGELPSEATGPRRVAAPRKRVGKA